MKKAVGLLLVLAVVIVAPLFVTGVSSGAIAAPEFGPHDLVVAPDGTETASGTTASPLSLVGAKEKLKALKDTLAEGERVRVYLRGGRYELNEKLCFTADDLPNVTYLAYDKEEVVFSGAKAISGFSEETVNGVRVFTKNLTSGIDLTGFKSLFSETETLRTPRYPESGYFTPKKLDTKNDLFTEDDSPWDLTVGQRSFFADPGDLKVDLTNVEDVQIRILHYWKDELATLTEFDRSTGKIAFSRPASMKIRTFDRYYFENVFEAMNEPGEWYLNNKTNKLYYVPKQGERADTLTLYASCLEQLMDISGVDGICFEGIRFTQTDWNMPDPKNVLEPDSWNVIYDVDTSQAAYTVLGVVTVRYAGGVSFGNCEFVNLGATGVKFMDGAKDGNVENCLFRNIAATGVYIGGPNCPSDDAACVKNVTVRNCNISAYGRKFYNAIGIHLTFCDGAVLENNEISDGYYTGISVGWVWGYGYHLTNNIKIRDNLIYNIGQGWLSDMGGIYMLGVQPGTEITGNVIHNVAADPGEGGYGGWGIYLDEGSSRMLIEKNLVFNCGSNGLNIHYGEGNIFRNNISAFNAEGQVSVGSRGEEKHATAFYYDNIFVSKDGEPIYVYMSNPSHFYENGNLMWDVTQGKKLSFALDSGRNKLSLSQAKAQDFLHNSTVADPLFKDIENYDFTLSENSPALKLNFKPWDYQNAGTIKNTIIGFSLAGGQTAHNAHVTAIDSVKVAGSGAPMVLRIILLVFLSLVLAFWIVFVLSKLKKKTVVAVATTFLAFIAGIIVYYFYVYWSVVPYMIGLVIMCLALAALPGIISYEKKNSLKKAALWGAVWFAGIFGGFFAITLLLNNLLHIGEVLTIHCSMLATLAVHIVNTISYILLEKQKGTRR